MSTEECTVFAWQPTDQMMMSGDESTSLLLSFRFLQSVLSNFQNNDLFGEIITDCSSVLKCVQMMKNSEQKQINKMDTLFIF